MREEILAKITDANLAKVNLVAMNISDDEILEIIDMIKQVKPSVSIINLDNNNISNKGAIALSKHLCDFSNLKELSLQFNNIGREGAIDLFSLKRVFSELDILFHGNKIINVGEMDEIERLAVGEPLRPSM